MFKVLMDKFSKKNTKRYVPECPSCYKNMVWMNDEEVEEEVFTSCYVCQDCMIDLTQYWGERAKETF